MKILENGLHFRSGGLSLVAFNYSPLAWKIVGGLRIWLFSTFDFASPFGLDDEDLPMWIRKVGVRLFGFTFSVALPYTGTEAWLGGYVEKALAMGLDLSQQSRSRLKAAVEKALGMGLDLADSQSEKERKY